MLLIRHLLAALVLVLIFATVSVAQISGTDEPDPARVRVRIGPLWMNPSISLPNLGVDTNVFNEPTDVTPKKDFTVTIAPRTEMWLQMGRTWLSGLVAEDIVWYRTYESERSVNGTYRIGWSAPLNRLVVGTSATWVNTRTRPGFEIDARARRREPTYAGSVEVRGFAKTYIGVQGSWRKVSFGEDEVFQGLNLKTELDRTSTSAAVTVRHELTPLTSLTLSVGRTRQQFTPSASRDATSDDVFVTFTFEPAALLRGSARFGYTDYKPESADLPGFRGTAMDVNLSYALLGSTLFSGSVTRGVEFSYDPTQPYYVKTGGTLSVAQQIFGPVDLVGRGSAHRLNYRTRAGVVTAAPDRTDRVRVYGVGVGYRLGRELRLGFNIDSERRRSQLTAREYEGKRYGTSITYGL